MCQNSPEGWMDSPSALDLETEEFHGNEKALCKVEEQSQA